MPKPRIKHRRGKPTRLQSLPAAVMTDSGLEYNGCKIFLLIPLKLGVDPQFAVTSFKYDMRLLVSSSNKTMMSDVYAKSFEVLQMIIEGKFALN